MALLVSAIFPVVVFLVIVYRKDTEKEPPKLLAKCFFLGCVATVPAMLLELLVDVFNNFDSAFARSFFDAFAVAALVEEGVKFAFLYWIVWKRKEFNQYFDGIVYAVFVSLGFALVENVFYVFDSGFGTAVLRAVLSVPGHGLFGVVMGYFFALARFSANRRGGLLWLSFLAPLLIHGLYDFLLMSIGAIENAGLGFLFFAGFVAFMIWLWRIGIKSINKHYAKDLEAYRRY